MNFDVTQIRQDFPILSQSVHGTPLVYLDNAATAQKPQCVLDAMTEYYTHTNANVHRGVHTLSDASTTAWMNARGQVAAFFGAQSEELILTRNSTEALNLAARGWGEAHVQPDDVIAVTLMEHHSNFVPWQELARRRQAHLVVLPLLPDGQLDWSRSQRLLSEAGSHLKVLAMVHVSNALGTINPIAEIGQWLNQQSWRQHVLFVADVAQSAVHQPLNLKELTVDAIAFSGHKLYGPMGIGGLIVTSTRLNEFEPVLFGGGMIDAVGVDQTTYAPDLVDRFTAGTPDVASLVGLAAALKWFTKIGWLNIQHHEEELLNYAWEQMSALADIELVGPSPLGEFGKHQRSGSVAFLYKGVHSHDVAQVLDRYGVAVRSGHHCTMPLHTHFGWLATTRASFAVYSTQSEVDALVEALKSVKKVFYA